MLNKVIMARYLGTEGLGIYMMILPSFILFLNISSFGFPVAVSKLVSEDDRNNKKLIFTSIIFVLFINFFVNDIYFVYSKVFIFLIYYMKKEVITLSWQ